MVAAAAKKTATPDFDEKADVQVSPEDWEWENVQDESPIGVVFEKHGEEFVGQYTGDRHVEREPNAKGEDQSFDLFIFRGRDGKPYSLNKSFILTQAMQKVQVGNWCRIRYVKDVQVSGWPTPMKDFTVDIRK